jgi:hypothetical protein
MAYPRYLREKAREMRIKEKLSLIEIADRLALPETTVYCWISDLPLGRSRRENGHPGNIAMQRKYRLIREEAYDLGRWEFPRLSRLPTFRDFVCLYIAEGYKRSRNSVAVANSDPAVIRVAAYWVRYFGRNPVRYSVQLHADQSFAKLAAFWGDALEVPAAAIGFQRKTNSSQLRYRKWRSKHGVLTVRCCDTVLRARLQGWVDRLQQAWLDSPHGA